jgi:3-deoxy-7-phosphoheptulonate synthase
MLVLMDTHATPDQVNVVCNTIESLGFQALKLPGAQRIAIGVVGNDKKVASDRVESLPGVSQVVHVSNPWKLVSREFYPDDTVIDVRGYPIGDDDCAVIAGPCAVESKEQIHQCAEFLSNLGVRFLRGGAYKPRTSPYAFKGLGEAGLQLLAETAEKFDMRVVTEVMDTERVDEVARYADVVQIGTRNMQNFSLLTKVGKINKPVLLKRGLNSTYKEWLMAAEYIVAEGNTNVILCERGIRTFETSTRNTLDITAVPVLKEWTHLPVIVDPSHACGIRRYVSTLSQAALAAGAHGIMVEVHPNPDQAMSDAAQTLDFDQFSRLYLRLQKMHALMRETISDIE